MPEIRNKFDPWEIELQSTNSSLRSALNHCRKCVVQRRVFPMRRKHGEFGRGLSAAYLACHHFQMLANATCLLRVSLSDVQLTGFSPRACFDQSGIAEIENFQLNRPP